MSKQTTNHPRRKLSAAKRKQYADMRRKIEEELPPGKPVKVTSAPSDPETLGDYFGLRSLVGELRKMREAQGFTLTDVHNMTGIDRAALCRLENGDNLNPTINTLIRYARAVGRRIEFALQKEQKESSSRPTTATFEANE